MLEGLPPNNAARRLLLTTTEAPARRAADAVVELFDPAATAAAAFEVEDSPLDPKPWRLEIYLGPEVDPGAVRVVLGQVLGDAALAGLTVEAIEARDWVARSLEGLTPVRAGRFLVHGGHSRALVRPNDIALEIEAALAFGTGHHGTTRGCLLALDRILKRRRPRNILDLGTGTGVLAMAAAKALKRNVAAGDLDPVAVEAAAGNAAMNGVGRFVRPVRAAGLAHPRLHASAPYDLVFANILAGPLKRMACAVAAHAAPGADLVLSGLLPRDVPGIVARYGCQGFVLRGRQDLEGWATLMLVRANRGRAAEALT
jgi:ribosomal protein L11 methyltransferase